MISRSAENCFWLCRHIERVESIARFLSVNYLFILDVKMTPQEAWFPFVIVAGEEERFMKLYHPCAVNNHELIQDYLTWESHNPVSILNTFRQVRENAQVIREIISLEMWESINSFWLWLNSKKSKSLYNKDRLEFYTAIRQQCLKFHGLFYTSILHEEAWDFMCLGMMLERASQTARIIDVKYHRISQSIKPRNNAVLETIHWLSLLQLCSANEAFSKKGQFMHSKKIAGFLLYEQKFPRAILFCLSKALKSVESLCENTDIKIGHHTHHALKKLIERVKNNSHEEICQATLHHDLTMIIDQISLVCGHISEDYFETSSILEITESHGAIQ